MPKTSKKKSKTKRKVNKACASKCKSTSVKFTGKDKKQFLKMCIASCSVDTKQFLLPKEQVLLFNITVMAMDIVDESKEKTEDIFRGNNNEQDVLNTQLAVLNKLVMVLRRGTLYSDKFQLEGDATLEPFYERFDNRLAGFAATMDIAIHNDISIC